MNRALKLLTPLFVGLGLILLWYLLSLIIGESLILPTPIETVKECFELFVEPSFWTALGGTFLRGVEAFLIAFLIALAASIVSALWEGAERALNAVFSVVRSIPTMSVILLLLIWLRPSKAPVVVALIVICPTLYSVFVGALKGVDNELKELCKVYRVSKLDEIRKVWIPSMALPLFEGTASSFSLNLKLVIAAEALAQTKASIGGMMQYAKVWIDTGELMALTLVAVLVGILCEFLIRFVGRRLVKWL